MKTIKDIPHLEGVKVLVRVDFNVPVQKGKVVDDFRIRAALPTIEYLRGKGATVIMISHLEKSDHGHPTLEPVAEHLRSLDGSVIFIKDWKKARETIDERAEAGGQAFLLENLRFFEGERTDDPKFAKELASLADIFVNEAFPVSHRAHASVVGVPRYIPGYAGLQFEKEVVNLSKAFDPARPFLFILGGAKFMTKMPLLEKFMSIADTVFVGGALATNFYKQKGYEIGKSMVYDLGSHDLGDKGPRFTEEDVRKISADPKLVLPVDAVNEKGETKPANGLSSDDMIMDSGIKTMEILKSKVEGAKFILWNGPLGIYENGYTGPTMELAKLIAIATEHGAESIVGGGDTIAAIEHLGIKDKFTFISTGGGAMLDFLAKGTLPGIEALESSSS